MSEAAPIAPPEEEPQPQPQQPQAGPVMRPPNIELLKAGVPLTFADMTGQSRGIDYLELRKAMRKQQAERTEAQQQALKASLAGEPIGVAPTSVVIPQMSGPEPGRPFSPFAPPSPNAPTVAVSVTDPRAMVPTARIINAPIYPGETAQEAVQRTRDTYGRAVTQSQALVNARAINTMMLGIPDYVPGFSHMLGSREALEEFRAEFPEQAGHIEAQGTIAGMLTPKSLPQLIWGLPRHAAAKVMGRTAFQVGVAEQLIGPKTVNPTFVQKLGQIFGNVIYKKARPQTLQNAQEALRMVGATIESNGVIQFAKQTTAEQYQIAKMALLALKSELASSIPLKLVKATATAAEGAIGGALVHEGYNLPPRLFGSQAEKEAARESATSPTELAKAAGLGGGLNLLGEASLLARRRTYEGLYDKVTMNVPPSNRVLGSRGNVVEAPRSLPTGPTGPTRPPISHQLATFRPPEAPEPRFAPRLALATEGAQRTLHGMTDPVEADRARKGIEAAMNLPLTAAATPVEPGAPPPSAQAIVEAQAAMLAGVRDLAGRDHAQISKALGIDHTGIVFGGGPPLPPEVVGPLVHVARWAAGVLDEAARMGVDLSESIAALPPPPLPDASLLSARIKGLADQVLAANPAAKVGPPPELLPAEGALLDAQPIALEPQGSAPKLPPLENLLDAPEAYPSALDFTVDPEGAAQRQQWTVANLSSWQPHIVGRLWARNSPSLSDVERSVIVVTADNEGRLIAHAQDPARLEGTVEIDVTAGLTPLQLPAFAKWDFVPDKSSPLGFKMDKEAEQLVLDQESTQDREWIQRSYRDNVLTEDAANNPLTHPFAFLKATINQPLGDHHRAQVTAQQADQLMSQHDAKRPTREIARRQAGPDATDWEIDWEHGQLLREHAALGSAIEAARALALDRLSPLIPPARPGAPVLGAVQPPEVLGRMMEQLRTMQEAPPPPGMAERRKDITRRRAIAREAELRLFHEVMEKAKTGHIPDLDTELQTMHEKLRRYQHEITEAQKALVHPAQEVSPAILDDLPAYTFQPLDVSKPVSGTFYHGTKADVASVADLDPAQFAGERALAGLGTYFTDNPRVAEGYAKTKGKGVGRVLRGEIQGARLLDLSQPFPPQIQAILQGMTVSGAALDPLPTTSGMDAIQALRREMADEGITSGEAVEILQNLTVELSLAGYDGFRYEGGALRGGHGPHNVVVMFPNYGTPTTAKIVPGTPARYPSMGAATPDEFAKRSAALAYMAEGRPWSQRPDLFKVLTDEEKFQAMLARIKSGHVPHVRPKPGKESPLERLNPRGWSAKPLKYFGGWQPTPEQLKVLQDAYGIRAQKERDALKAINTLKSRLQARPASRSISLEPLADIAPGIAKLPPITITRGKMSRIPVEELVKIHPEELAAIAEKDPRLHHEIFAQVWQSLDDGIDNARVDDLVKLDQIRSVLNTLGDEALENAPHPMLEQRNPLSGWERVYMGARQGAIIAKTMLEQWQKPGYAVGTWKQAPHPLDIKKEIEAGRFQKSLFWDLSNSHLKYNQAIQDAYHEFHLLAEATSRSVELDKAINFALRQGLPDSELNQRSFTVRVRSKNVNIRLAEWVPKLRKFYDDIITKAENEMTEVHLMQAAGYKNDLLHYEQEIHRRLTEAVNAATWEEVSPKDVTLEEDPKKGGQRFTGPLHKKLMESNAKGSPNGVSYVRGEPMDLSGYGYKDLHGLWKGAKNEYRKRLEEIADIESGSLRRANYQTQLHKLGREEIRHALANEYSNVARYSDPKVVSKFLEERLGDDPGFESWLAGWFLYVPSVLKKVHMEPAFMRAKQRMKTLPNEFQKNYVHHWIGALRGADTPYFAMLNRLAVENTAQPIATDALYKAVFGRDPADIAKQAREEGQLDHRMVQSASQNVNGWLYMTLIGLGRIVKLNATEFGYLARELSKRPLPDLALGVPWAIKGFAKTTLDGLKESAGFVANQVNPELPRWYSEPTRMQVNDFLHDMADEVAQQGPEQVGGMGTRARRAVNHLWSPLLRASEFMIRGTNNYTWLSRVKRYISPEFLIEHGYDPDDFYKTIAANDTNRNVGSFGPRDVSPHTRGIVGKAYLPLRRFTWTHTGHLGAAIGGSMEAGHRGAAAIAGKVGLGNRIPGPGEPSDMDPPDPPPPPDVPGAEFNDWSDRERAAWTAYHTPSPAYGEGVPRGSAASMRWLYTAALGWPIAGWALYSIAQSVFTDEDHMSDSRAVDMLNPVDLRRSAEIPVLHGVEALYDAAYLPGKMWAFGRTPRDRDKLADARRDLVFKIPIYGRHTSETYWKVKRREAWDRRIMEADVQDIAKRHNIKLPKMPPPQTWWWETDPMVDKIIEDALTTGYEKDPSSLILQPGVISRVKKRFKEAIGIESEADKRVKAALERLEALKAAEAQPPQEQQP